jgi:hypothetical protein
MTSAEKHDKQYCFYELLPDGRIQFFVDASLLKTFSHCERMFYLKHIKNLRPKGSNVVMPFPMAIGRWWSDVMELFYNQLRDNQSIAKQKIQEIAVIGWAMNRLDDCALADPERFSTFGDLAGAVLMLNEYHDSQYLIDQRNWHIIGVEEGFGLKKEVLVGETRNVIVYWIGKPDLVVFEGQRLIPVDHKTVGRIDAYTSSRYKPSTQMCGYAYSTEIIAKSLGIDARVDRCVVNICSRSRPSDNPRNGKKKPRFIRAYPNFNREEVAEWKRDVINKCERIAHCIKHPDSWTWSETTCHNFYMRPCDFLKADSSTPSARDIVLATDFAIGEPWVPYQVSKEREADD